MERGDGIRALGCSQNCTSMLVGKRAQLRLHRRSRRSSSAQHQHVDMLADRHFDLRHAVADRQLPDQLAQRRDQRGDVRRRALRSSAMSATKLLRFSRKPTSASPFLSTQRTDSRARGDSPSSGRAGRQHGVGLDLADVPQVVFQHALLDGDLRAGFQMLHRAAAADAEIVAARFGALRAGLEDGDGVGQFVLGVLAVDGDFRTVSPASAPSTKMTLPSMRAMPRPSWSRDENVDDRIHAQAARNSCQCGAAWLAHGAARAVRISAA